MSHYRKTYGRGKPPDLTRCCQEVQVYPGNWPSYHQCRRPRGHGPEQAYCKQHDPAAAETRRAALTARSKEKWDKRRYELYGKQFFDALKQIADGHNDPRTLAKETIKPFEKDEK